MDVDLGLIPIVGFKDLLQFLNFLVALLQTEILGQDEMKIHIQAFSGPAGPELVDIDPASFSDVLSGPWQFPPGVRGRRRP